MILQRPPATGKVKIRLLENCNYNYNCCYYPQSGTVIVLVASVCMCVIQQKAHFLSAVILTGYGSSSYSKVLVSRSKSQKQKSVILPIHTMLM